MKTPQVEVSVCCHAKPLEDFKENPRDHHDPEPIYVCSRCKKECDVEEVCEYCGGTGEVNTDEEDGEGHLMRGVGTEKCQCQLKDETED